MGGIFAVAAKEDCVPDVFFGTDYHSHLGTKRGGMCVYGEKGFDRAIHNIENSPFRTKFEKEVTELEGRFGIGSISDGEPQPLTVLSRQGSYAIATVGRINNKAELVDRLLNGGGRQFLEMNGGGVNNTELVAALISTQKNLLEGIKYVQEEIQGSCTLVLLTAEGIYAARDKVGRTPLIIGKKERGYCAASESFSFINLGYEKVKELGPGEIVFFDSEEMKQLNPPGEKLRICTFLWTYYGYTTSTYEGVNVEKMRYRNGASIAAEDMGLEVDNVAGVPDSGIAHALGYAHKSGLPYARPLIKYTPTWPRSFMPQYQKTRDLIAKMKLVPVHEIIEGKKFVLIDDSIVRGTQLSETVKYLYEHGAEEIHVRSACAPIMFGCKYLNFARSVTENELITRRAIAAIENGQKTGIEAVATEPASNEKIAKYLGKGTGLYEEMNERIRKHLNFDSLKYHDLDGTLNAVGIDHCKLCTYCWNGKE